MLSENVTNFIKSKDVTAKNSVAYRLIFLCLLLVCCGIEVVFFCLKINFIGKTSGLFDLIVTVIIAALGLGNFIAGLFISNEKFHYLYYGVISLLISVFLFYIGIRLALFPLSELYGLLGIGSWLIISIICILGILDNIKCDRYNPESPNIHWFNGDSADDKYGIVVTKFTVIGFITVMAIIVGIVIMYFAVFPKLFTAGTVTFSRVWQLVVISCLLILSYIGHYAWKLIIKQIYVNRMDN